MRTTRDDRWRLALALAAAGQVLSGSSCDCLGLEGAIADPVTQAVNVLDDAIDALQNASADWQKVLQDAQRKLTEDAQSTIRIPVELRQTGNCVPQGTVRSLKERSLISPAALHRLEPRALLEFSRVKGALERP